MGKERIKELDFLKGIMIVLMVIFHLVYIADTYPYAKQVVYTFHIPVFLVLSGYLANVAKKAGPFLQTILGMAIPYLVMETLYASMTAFLPVRERIDAFTLPAVAEAVLTAPLGPYWYLHTLVICLCIYYVVERFVAKRMSAVSRFIVTALLLYGVSLVLGGFAFSRVIYFMTGVAIRQSGRSFTEVIPRSAWAALPLVLLCAEAGNLDYGTLPGYAVNILMISFLLWAFCYTPEGIREGIRYLGKNTLVILVFSPVFTIVTKQFVPFLAFDPTGMLFMILSTSFVIGGCLLLAKLSDKLRFSRLFFRKEVIYIPLR